MIDRTLIALFAGVIAFLVVLIGSWMLLEAYKAIGWQVPLAAGVAVFSALWAIDAMTEYLARRRPDQ